MNTVLIFWTESIHESFCGEVSLTLDFLLQRYIQRKDHPEHIKLVDLIAQMLEYDPAKRPTLAEIINHSFFDALPKEKRFIAPSANYPRWYDVIAAAQACPHLPGYCLLVFILFEYKSFTGYMNMTDCMHT